MILAWYQCATTLIIVEIIKVFRDSRRWWVGEVPMSNEILKIQPDTLKEFDVLWEACAGGPDASVQGLHSSRPHLTVPRSPRRLRAEDFRDWLLP